MSNHSMNHFAHSALRKNDRENRRDKWSKRELIEPPKMLTKRDEQEAVERQTKLFVRSGGKIQRIPAGVSGYQNLSAGRRSQIVISAKRGGKR